MNKRHGITLQMHPEVYPYLVTRVVPTLYHIILLPKGEQDKLIKIASAQVSFNKLESCLVLAPREALYIYPDGSEMRSSDIPTGGVLVHDRLRPWKAFPDDRELSGRKDLLEKYIGALKQEGYLLGDLTKGGRKPTPREAQDLRGIQENGVPRGLDLCPRCGEWQGTCLDSIPDLGERAVEVSCLCQNDNRCAGCGGPLYERKVNANYYNPKDGKIWRVPGFSGLGHTCKYPVLNQKQAREATQRSVQSQGTSSVLFMKGTI